MGDATWGKMHDANWTETKDLPAEVAPWLEELYGGEEGKISELSTHSKNGERNGGGQGRRDVLKVRVAAPPALARGRFASWKLAAVSPVA